MAYYYNFKKTGNILVDSILQSVSCAGKAFHHTEQWNDETGDMYDQKGETPVAWIQNTANEVAQKLNSNKMYLFTYDPPYGEKVCVVTYELSDEIIKNVLLSFDCFKNNIETESGYRFMDYIDTCTVEELMQEKEFDGERILLKIEDSDCDNHWVYFREVGVM